MIEIVHSMRNLRCDGLWTASPYNKPAVTVTAKKNKIRINFSDTND